MPDEIDLDELDTDKPAPTPFSKAEFGSVDEDPLEGLPEEPEEPEDELGDEDAF